MLMPNELFQALKFLADIWEQSVSSTSWYTGILTKASNWMILQK